MKIIFCIILFIVTFDSIAGFYIEPYYLKSGSGQSKEKKNPNNINDEYDFKGQAFGTRFGVSWENKYIAGFDISQSESEWELSAPEATKTTLTNAGNSQTDKWEAQHFGVFAGNRTNNWIFTVSAFYTTYKDTNDNSLIPKGDKLEGHTFSFGAGYAIGGLLKLSIEWRGSTLRKYSDKSENKSYSLPNKGFGMGEYRTQEYYIGLSLPITIGKK